MDMGMVTWAWTYSCRHGHVDSGHGDMDIVCYNNKSDSDTYKSRCPSPPQDHRENTNTRAHAHTPRARAAPRPRGRGPVVPTGGAHRERYGKF